MLVSRCIENNVNILANSPTAENISSTMKHMPFIHYLCEDITDTFMIPGFILVLDGHVLANNNREINLFECFLAGWSGRMKKCPHCKTYHDCLKSTGASKDIDFGPEYKAPVILLHADKKQREVEGLVALIPPVPINEPFSSELEYWLRLTCFSWYKKALRWRGKNDQLNAVECQKELCKHKKYSEIAEETWLLKNIKIELNLPGFEAK